MALHIFNTLSRSLETFEPLDPEGRKVGLYCCGPTVHDHAHIGNFRTFVFVDLMRRYLEFRGYAVRHVMNVTDVEDKIIRRVRESGGSLKDYTGQYRDAFFEDLKALGCLPPHETPHATEHIGDIIGLIKKLEKHGIAYQASDGSVYFSIQRFRDSGGRYGQLLNLNFEAMRQGDRVSRDEYEKDAVADFALWKARSEEDGEIFWKSPWGEGRPGWHIECSAMSMKKLGPSLDLHMGGEDLIFPHHEDEIAQSEGAQVQPENQRFVKYWMHAAHLLVEGKKMSKSLGNFFTLRDLLNKGYNGREIRYLLLTAHYREQFNFTLEGLQGGRSALGRLDECLKKLLELSQGRPSEPEARLIEDFTGALDEDLNISKAWGIVFEWVRANNRALDACEMSEETAAAKYCAWQRIDAVLGVGAELEIEVPDDVLQLAEERQTARKARDFARADAIRDELKSKGWILEDTPKGLRVKRA